jgi:hypothetical protein
LAKLTAGSAAPFENVHRVAAPGKERSGAEGADARADDGNILRFHGLSALPATPLTLCLGYMTLKMSK